MSSKARNPKVGCVKFQTEKMMKKKWKPFKLHLTKMYLLYYKAESKTQNADGRILLSSICRLETDTKEASTYPLQVHFKPKKAELGAGSPWVFDLSSNEERMEWMEAIKPGSSEHLQRFSKSGSLHRVNSPQTSLQYDPYSLAGADPSNGHYESVDVSSSWRTVGGQHSPDSVPAQPMNYMEPVPSQGNGQPRSHHQRAHTERTRSEETFDTQAVSPPGSSSADARLIHSLKEQSQRVNPRQAPHRSTIAHSDREPKTASLSRSFTEKVEYKSPEPNVLYEMDTVSESSKPPLPNRPPPTAKPRNKQPPSRNLSGSLSHSQAKASRSSDLSPDEAEPPRNTRADTVIKEPEYPVSSPRTTQQEHNSNKPPIARRRQPMPVEKPLKQTDYLELSKPDGPKPTSPSAQSTGAQASTGVQALPGISEQMLQNFTSDQVDMIISMLQQVQSGGKHQPAVKEKEPEQGASTAGISSDNSLRRKNFERAVSYTPQLQTDKILVTEDDDSDGYESRPDWAKAVSLRQSNADHDPDTLSDLQEEALYIPRSRLADFTVIGEGQFGKVFRAAMQRGSEPISVAVKTAKKSTSSKEKEEFSREMNVMSQMVHPNIVQLYGIIRDDVPAPWIVLEYLGNGDIKGFLMKNKRPIEKLVKYMIDVSMGMHYLSERGLVHRDLAARNVLVGESETCKVSDFGLSRELPKDDSIYHMQTNVPCPVRWMPPESISDRTFSPASDVWSFGILQWEMFYPHKTPYEDLRNIEVAMKVMKGFRLEIPPGCPPLIGRIMKACWHQIPNKRPSFLLISTLLTTKVTFTSEDS